MTEREARIAFNMIPTVGAVTLAKLMRETHGSAAAAYEFYPEKKDWDGKVEKKRTYQRRIRSDPDSNSEFYEDVYEIKFRTKDGKKKKLKD